MGHVAPRAASFRRALLVVGRLASSRAMQHGHWSGHCNPRRLHSGQHRCYSAGDSVVRIDGGRNVVRREKNGSSPRHAEAEPGRPEDQRSGLLGASALCCPVRAGGKRSLGFALRGFSSSAGH